MTFSEELENEFNEMAFVLENVDNACWVYAVYNQAVAREEIIKRLKTEIALPFFLWDYSEEKPYPIDYLRDLTEEQKQNRAIVSFFNTTDGGEKTIKSLDFNREKFAEQPHSLVFWVTENELGEMARGAGHFWAQRRGTFNFSKLLFPVRTITTGIYIDGNVSGGNIAGRDIIFNEDFIQSYSYGTGEWLNSLLNINNYQEALQQLEFYQQVLSEYLSIKQTPDNTQRFIAETDDKISYLLYYLGRYSEAICFCEKSLNFYRILLGGNAYSTIITKNNLALLYLENRRLKDAKPLLERALYILKRHTSYDFAIAVVLNNLALLYSMQGKYGYAESRYKHSFEIREKKLGQYHPDTARSMNNLGKLYYVQGKYTEAETLYKRSLKIWDAVLNKDDPSIAAGLNNLALLYSKQGKYTQAEQAYNKAINIALKILGRDHPNTERYEENYEQLLIEKIARNKSNQS